MATVSENDVSESTLVRNFQGTMAVPTTRHKPNWPGRCCLPETMVTRNDFSLWSFLKVCIGKELSKISMPIVFNEPLSFLQRVVEYLEYAQLLLDKASNSSDALERMELVTAFAVSATASNWKRIGKPFNPLLGETFELDRRHDLGFRIICEQVEHHPPISAFYAESANYTFHGTIHPKVKFWGSSVLVTPRGLVTLRLHRHNEIYSWQNVNCSVHNIIIGKVWVEHFGEMTVKNHTTNMRSVLQFKPCGWTGADLHKVQGYLYNSAKKKMRCFYGKWVEALYSCDVTVWEKLSRSSWRETDDRLTLTNASAVPDNVPHQANSSCNLNLPGQKLLWLATPKPDDAKKYYNFTLFAMMLNEFDTKHLSINLPPTDSRFRPDIRFMEQADVERASAEKSRLEEKQREQRKDLKRAKEDWKPRWFSLGKNGITGDEEWQFTGEYWKRNWAKCNHIF